MNLENNTETDDLGYETTSTTGGQQLPPPNTPPVDDKTGYTKKDETTLPPPNTPPVDDKTGYTKKDETTLPPPPATPPATPPVDNELSEVLKELPESFDKQKLNDFAVKNKMNKDQVKAYVDMIKEDEIKTAQEEQDHIKATRASWQEELNKDPDFGGENFAKNVDRVNKLIENFMPNVKKVLTERGSMLPPYIMRDFLALEKIINPQNNLVVGSASSGKEEKNFLDELYE